MAEAPAEVPPEPGPRRPGVPSRQLIWVRLLGLLTGFALLSWMFKDP